MIDPTQPHPIVFPDGTAHLGTVLLAAVIKHPQFQVGPFTYASDFDPPEATSDWAQRLAPYLFEFSNERLVIGRFCQIAHGARFITSSANHDTRALSTFPFPVFDADRRAGYQPDTRDTVIGHDVWIGSNAMVLPGARIGNGAIIGAGAVVRGQVPDYAIVTGNPGAVARFRFGKAEIARLKDLAWWDWPVETIAAAQDALCAADLDALEKFAP